MKIQPLLGAHVSIAGGIEHAIIEGTILKCTAIQLFTKNNRQWSFSVFSKEEASTFKDALKTSAIEIVVSHSSYLINIGSPKVDLYEKSLRALDAEYKRCLQIDAPYLVLHPGAFINSTKEESIARIATGINAILEKNPGETKILLENMAGQGTTIGSSFEELQAIYKKIKQQKRVGFCFDTCHAFAAGYDLTTKDACAKTFEKFDTILGLEKLHVLHLNDSKKELGSHLDRHETIGKGKIGIDAFSYIMNEKCFDNTAKIIETPRETIKDHAENLRILRSLII